jgi:hypothetical protein
VAIIGAHVLLYTPEAEALRSTLREAFGWAHVGAGEGWLIFALPPAELGVHPGETTHHELSWRPRGWRSRESRTTWVSV